MQENRICMGFSIRPVTPPEAEDKDMAYYRAASRLFQVMKKVQEIYPVFNDWHMLDLSNTKYESLQGEIETSTYYGDTTAMRKVVDTICERDIKEVNFPNYLDLSVGMEKPAPFFIGYTWCDCRKTQASDFTETVCDKSLSIQFPPKSQLPEVYNTDKFIQLAEYLITSTAPSWFTAGDEDYVYMRLENPPVGLDYYEADWITYVDAQIAPSDIPEAYLVKPLAKGTLIISQPEPLNVKENQQDFITVARIEQRLFSLGLLPKVHL